MQGSQSALAVHFDCLGNWCLTESLLSGRRHPIRLDGEPGELQTKRCAM